MSENKCKWKEDNEDFKWDTSCGQGFFFEYDGPKENKFIYCPYCGKELEQETTEEKMIIFKVRDIKEADSFVFKDMDQAIKTVRYISAKICPGAVVLKTEEITEKEYEQLPSVAGNGKTRV